jgi:hypothetical protein
MRFALFSSLAALILLALSPGAVVVNAFRVQSVAVRGRLLCGTVPAKDVLVKLFDEDDGQF